MKKPHPVIKKVNVPKDGFCMICKEPKSLDYFDPELVMKGDDDMTGFFCQECLCCVLGIDEVLNRPFNGQLLFCRPSF